MSDDGEEDGGDPDGERPSNDEPVAAEPVDDRPAGDGRLLELRLEGVLEPVTGLLGSLVGLGADTGSPLPGDSVDWTTVEERTGGGAPGDRGSGGGRTRRTGETREGEYLLDTRFDGEEFVVTADIPGTSRDDLTVGIDPDTTEFVIKRDGTELERIATPWESVEPVRVLFNNGVLEARFRPGEP